MKGWRALSLGDSARARTTFDSVVAGRPVSMLSGEWSAMALMGLGRGGDALTVMDTLVRRSQQRNGRLSNSYLVHQAEMMAQAGRAEQAIGVLEVLIRDPLCRVTPALLRLDPVWAPLRGNPRFERLAAGP
jgi:serine/threonine-protein kinase